MASALVTAQNALFGCLFVIERNRAHGASGSYVELGVKTAQMLTFAVSDEAGFVWAASSMSGVRTVLGLTTINGYAEWFTASSFAGLFYFSLLWVCMLVALFMWATASFARGSFAVLWPLKLLRAVGSTSATVLYIPMLTILLAGFRCEDEAALHPPSGARSWWLASNFNCAGAGWVVQEVITGLAIAMFVCICTLWAACIQDRDPMSSNMSAKQHGRVDVFLLAAKTVLVATIKGWPQVIPAYIHIGILLVVGLGWVLGSTYFLPYYQHTMNRLNAAAAVMFLTCVVCLAIAQYSYAGVRGSFDGAIAWYLSLPLSAAFGILLADARASHIATCPVTALSSAADIALRARFILHEALFGHPTATLPVSARALARVVGVASTTSNNLDTSQNDDLTALEQEDESDARAVIAQRVFSRASEHAGVRCTGYDPLADAQSVYETGMARFRHSALLQVAASAFHTCFTGNKHMQMSHLLQAERLTTAIDIQYVAFARRRALEERGSTSSGTGRGAPSALARVAYEKYLTDARAGVSSTLSAQALFWTELCNPRPSLVLLHTLVTRMNASADSAAKGFGKLEDMHAQSLVAVRMQAEFALYALNDADRAATLISEAERIEENVTKELESANGRRIRFLHSSAVDIMADSGGIVTISAAPGNLGTIVSVNPAACRIFGYAKHQMERRSISMLVPAPISEWHAGFLRRFLATGQSKLVDATVLLLGLHKAGYIVPMLSLWREAQYPSGPIVVAILQPMSTTDEYLLLDADLAVCSSSPHAMTLLGLDQLSHTSRSRKLGEFIPNVADYMAEMSTDAGMVVQLLPSVAKEEEIVPATRQPRRASTLQVTSTSRNSTRSGEPAQVPASIPVRAWMTIHHTATGQTFHSLAFSSTDIGHTNRPSVPARNPGSAMQCPFLAEKGDVAVAAQFGLAGKDGAVVSEQCASQSKQAGGSFGDAVSPTLLGMGAAHFTAANSKATSMNDNVPTLDIASSVPVLVTSPSANNFAPVASPLAHRLVMLSSHRDVRTTRFGSTDTGTAGVNPIAAIGEYSDLDKDEDDDALPSRRGSQTGGDKGSCASAQTSGNRRLLNRLRRVVSDTGHKLIPALSHLRIVALIVSGLAAATYIGLDVYARIGLEQIQSALEASFLTGALVNGVQLSRSLAGSICSASLGLAVNTTYPFLESRRKQGMNVINKAVEDHARLFETSAHVSPDFFLKLTTPSVNYIRYDSDGVTDTPIITPEFESLHVAIGDFLLSMKRLVSNPVATMTSTNLDFLTLAANGGLGSSFADKLNLTTSSSVAFATDRALELQQVLRATLGAVIAVLVTACLCLGLPMIIQLERSRNALLSHFLALPLIIRNTMRAQSLARVAAFLAQEADDDEVGTDEEVPLSIDDDDARGHGTDQGAGPLLPMGDDGEYCWELLKPEAKPRVSRMSRVGEGRASRAVSTAFDTGLDTRGEGGGGDVAAVTAPVSALCSLATCCKRSTPATPAPASTSVPAVTWINRNSSSLQKTGAPYMVPSKDAANGVSLLAVVRLMLLFSTPILVLLVLLSSSLLVAESSIDRAVRLAHAGVVSTQRGVLMRCGVGNMKKALRLAGHISANDYALSLASLTSLHYFSTRFLIDPTLSFSTSAGLHISDSLGRSAGMGRGLEGMRAVDIAALQAFITGNGLCELLMDELQLTNDYFSSVAACKTWPNGHAASGGGVTTIEDAFVRSMTTVLTRRASALTTNLTHGVFPNTTTLIQYNTISEYSSSAMTTLDTAMDGILAPIYDTTTSIFHKHSLYELEQFRKFQGAFSPSGLSVYFILLIIVYGLYVPRLNDNIQAQRGLLVLLPPQVLDTPAGGPLKAIALSTLQEMGLHQGPSVVRTETESGRPAGPARQSRKTFAA